MQDSVEALQNMTTRGAEAAQDTHVKLWGLHEVYEEMSVQVGDDLGHPGHASNQQHFIDVRRRHSGVLHAVTAGLLCAV